MFKAPFSFAGRIGRIEYLLTWLGLIFAASLSSGITIGYGMVFWAIIMLVALWVVITQGWKRAHDAGWHGIIGAIPYVNFVLLFVSGDQGTNAYGPNPRLGANQPSPPQPSPSTYTPPPVPEAWERARQSDAPRIRTISFKCGACGAQNANVEYQGTACCQFCGAPKE
jgi:uncharacterized membrane protein YhaH (DUF805 family)